MLSLHRQKPSPVRFQFGAPASSPTRAQHQGSRFALPAFLGDPLAPAQASLPCSQSSGWEALGKPRVHSFHMPCAHTLTHSCYDNNSRTPAGCPPIHPHFDTTRRQCRPQKLKVRVLNKATLTSGDRRKGVSRLPTLTLLTQLQTQPPFRVDNL